jgi:hypothetical protein
MDGLIRQLPESVAHVADQDAHRAVRPLGHAAAFGYTAVGSPTATSRRRAPIRKAY